MPHSKTKKEFLFALLELFCLWCIFILIAAYYLEYASISIACALAWATWNCVQVQRELNFLPHYRLLELTKANGKRNNRTDPESLNNADKVLLLNLENSLRKFIPFCAFITNDKTRQGFRALIASAVLCGLVSIGIDWLILFLLIAVLFLIGICKLIQGGIQVL